MNIVNRSIILFISNINIQDALSISIKFMYVKTYVELSPFFDWTKFELVMLDIFEMVLIKAICVADGYIRS